ncbi:hypothetical protein PO909_032529 [Leuciscus waleckii]
MAHYSRGKMLVEMALKRRHQEQDSFKDYCVREDDTKTWTILDSCLDISFPEFGSEDLFNSTPDTSLNVLLDFSRSPDTATLPVSNTTGALVPATLPVSNTTGELVPATPPACLPATNTTGALSTLAPPMREPCGQKCRRKCSEKFSEEWRKKIWAMYWNMDYTEKRAFMFCNITQLPTARLFVPKGTSRRSRSFVYRLKNEDQVPQQVCKNLFLATLGYHPTNDSLVLSVMRSDMGNERITKDQRGRHTPPGNKLDLQPLLDHIESFHHSVSHYRREHAPHHRYLPSDISIKLMYADWLEKGNRCSYETYRKAVRQRNISFTKLGEEECEECLLHEQHKHACDDDVIDCLQCERWRKHKNSALQGRLAYQADTEKDWQGDTSVRSVDLQKVIMLPRMPGVKTAIFTRRIVAYHETFASVGKKGNKKHTISVVWHEGMAGRSAQEIASAYVMALEKERDVRHSIYWVDNCASQNKNWCLLCTLVCTINAATSEREGALLFL